AMLAAPHYGAVLMKRASALKDPRVLIGRGSGCDIVLDHPSVSANHAWMDSDNYGNQLVWDRGSKNGTRVNGVRVDSKTPIRAVPGDRITFGDVVAAHCPLP